jgi:hypothetical protein
MDLTHCIRQAYGDTRYAAQVERVPTSPIEYPIAGARVSVVEYEDCSLFMTSELEVTSGATLLWLLRRNSRDST